MTSKTTSKMRTINKKRQQIETEIRLTHLSSKRLLKEKQTKNIYKKDYGFYKKLAKDDNKRNKHLHKLEDKLVVENDRLTEIRHSAYIHERKPEFLMATIMIAIIGLLFISNLDGITTLTGSAISTGEESITQIIGIAYTQNSILDLNLQNATSLRINGKIIGSGRTRVWLDINGTRYAVIDRDTLSVDNLITGQVVDNGSINLSVTINETIEIVNETTEPIVNETIVETRSGEAASALRTERPVMPNDKALNTPKNKPQRETNVTVNETVEPVVNETINETVEPIVNETITEPVVNETTPPTETISELIVDNECVDTCSLNIAGGQLIIELENTSLQLDSITYTVPVVEPQNTEPTQTTTIENMIIENETTILAADYFTDADGDTLTLDIKQSAGVTTVTAPGSITLTPATPGIYEVFLYYTDGISLKRSNDFNITIPGEVPSTNETTNVTNETETGSGSYNITTTIITNETTTISVETELLPKGLIKLNKSNAHLVKINLKDKHGNVIGQFKKTVSDDGLTLELEGKTKKVKVKGKGIGLEVQEVDVKPNVKIKNIKEAPAELDIIIDETNQTIANGHFTTPIIYVDHIIMEEAEISLPKSGKVNSILRCRNFIKETFTCPKWERVQIPFSENETHISFVAKRFSGYGGGNLTIITLQSYPTKYGEWKVDFSTLGKEDLIIEGYNGTLFGVDLEHQSLKCGNTELNAAVSGNTVTYADFECNETASHTVRVLTDGKHIQKFTFGESVGYANNLASNVPKTLNIQGKLTNSTGNVNGSHNFTFRLFTVYTGGSNVWEENQTLTVNDGVYDAILGTTTSLDGIDFDGQYFLELAVNNETMSPRINLTSTPYTERARRADSLECTDCINESHITNGTIVDADISSSAAIAASKISGTALTNSTSFTGEVTGNFDSIVLSDSALDDVYIELTDTFAGDVGGTYGATTISANTIGTTEIVDDSINASDLNATNAPGDNQVLTYDSGTGGFTWEADQTGSGDGTAGWTNTSTTTQTGLNVNITNSTGASKMFVNVTSGYVGIGTTDPSSELQVSGTIVGTTINASAFYDDGVLLGDILGINTNGEYLLGGAGSGTVSLTVNETKLNETIDARDSDTTYTESSMYLILSSTVFDFNETKLNETINALQLSESQVEAFVYDDYNNLSSVWNVTGSGTNDIIFDLNTFFLDISANRIGIGTNAPTHELHVVGSVNITQDLYIGGSLYGGGGDIAEEIPASEELESGDVVIIDITKNETVKKSDSAYSTLVAGIVTTDPAMIMTKGDGGTPIALVGRVPVKVTTDNGAIQVGDLLTTSNKPGYAMRCEDRMKCVGAIVGKALEPISEGDGMIIALLTLG